MTQNPSATGGILASTKHPHEPAIPPTLDDEGRCLVCGLGVRIEKLEAAIRQGHELVEQMDRRMPEHATEDEDGWINSYRIPVGPWHRLLAWARDGALQPPGTPEEPNPMHEALTRIQEICRNDPDAVNAATTCEAIATHALGQSL